MVTSGTGSVPLKEYRADNPCFDPLAVSHAPASSPLEPSILQATFILAPALALAKRYVAQVTQALPCPLLLPFPSPCPAPPPLPPPLPLAFQVFIAAGTIILWVGFYGFNSGSISFVGQGPVEWVQEVARVCVNTTISAAFSGVTVWTFTYRQKEPVPEDTFNGVIGGLVAACATSSVVEPYAAAIIGGGGGGQVGSDKRGGEGVGENRYGRV